MNKKIGLLILAFIVIIPSLVYSAAVTITTAEQVAMNWYSERNDRASNDFAIVESFIEKENTENIYYIFNFDKTGFVMVSADDDATPILGYVFEHNYTLENHPPQFDAMLASFKEQIVYAKENNLSASQAAQDEWERLNVRTENFERNRDFSRLGPLLSTTWNQGQYYNEMCPVDIMSTTGNGYVWAGCVATAMAQVMKYWNHPTTGTSSHGYTHPTYGYLSADFSATTYNWAGMPDNVTSLNSDIQTLLYHCGVSVDMDYGSNGSGAYTSDVVSALETYFDYDTSAYYDQKAYHSDTEWENMIRDNLDNSRPLQYRGYGSGGHSFNLDGYEDLDISHFHFNWGWSGSYDGYFYLDDLTPGSYSFTTDQAAIFDIFPAGSSEFDPPTNLTATVVNDDDVDLEWDAPLTETILWDQIDPEGETYGKAAQDFGATNAIYTCEVAGDFVLTEEVTLTAARFVFFYNATHTDPCPFNVGIFPDLGGYPGETALYTTSTNSATPDVNNVFTLEFDTPIVLSAGTYWIGYNIILDYAVYGTQGYANMRTTLDNGTAGYWRNPGDGFVTGFTTWTQDVKNDLDEPRDLAYQILGNYGSRSEEIVNHNFDKQSSIASQNIFSKTHNADNLQKPVISASNENISNYDYSHYSNTRNTRSLSGYKIYRDSFYLDTVSDPGTTTYTDYDLAEDIYSYYVTATYSSPDGESVPSNTANATIGTLIEAILSYYPDIEYYMSVPDNNGISKFGVYFTPADACDLTKIRAYFYGTLGTPTSCDLRIYDALDDGTGVEYPNNLLHTENVPIASIPAGWSEPEFVLTSPIHFNAGENFFIIYEVVGTYDTDVVYLLRSEGITGGAEGTHSIAEYGGNWVYHDVLWSTPFEMAMDATVEYAGPVAPNFTINPASVDFLRTAIGGWKTQIVTLQNSGGGQVVVSGVSMAGDIQIELYDYNTYPDTLFSGESINFLVAYGPDAVETNSATITVSETSSRTDHYIPIDGEGYNHNSWASGSPVFDQPPIGNQGDYGWSMGTSDAAPNYLLAGNFWSIPGEITAIEFWGINWYYDGGWIQSDVEDPMTFEIKFYEDHLTEYSPAAEVASFSIPLSRTTVDTVTFSSGPVYKYRAELPTSVVLTDGWVSIRGTSVSNPVDPWFLWSQSPIGDHANVTYDYTNIEWDFEEYDVAFALYVDLLPPADVEVSISGTDAIVSWTPEIAMYYNVYSDSDPNGSFSTLAGTVTDGSGTFPDPIGASEKKFYRVTTVSPIARDFIKAAPALYKSKFIRSIEDSILMNDSELKK